MSGSGCDGTVSKVRLACGVSNSFESDDIPLVAEKYSELASLPVSHWVTEFVLYKILFLKIDGNRLDSEFDESRAGWESRSNIRFLDEKRCC